jgi:5-(carboxyamino)imidazole ribonucleotide synthase
MDTVLEQEGIHVHLYGKKITKPFRKMGHVTVTANEAEGLKEKVNFVKEHLKIKA